MPFPASSRQQLIALCDDALDAFLASAEYNENFRFTLNDVTIKVHIFRNSIDHPDGFMVRVVVHGGGA